MCTSNCLHHKTDKYDCPSPINVAWRYVCHPSWCRASRYFSPKSPTLPSYSCGVLSQPWGRVCLLSSLLLCSLLMMLSVHKLDKCFPTRVPQNMVNMFRQKPWNKSIKFWHIANNSKYSAKHSGNFFPGRFQYLSNHLEQSNASLVYSVNPYLRLYLAVLCLCSLHISVEPPYRWPQ